MIKLPSNGAILMQQEFCAAGVIEYCGCKKKVLLRI
jgi:hypothetical protein